MFEDPRIAALGGHMRARALCNFFCRVAAVALPSIATAESCGDMTVLSSRFETGERIELVLKSEMLERTKGWEVGHGEPPLPLGKASAVATNWARAHLRKFERVEISRIEFNRSPCLGSGERWYYVFEFSPFIGGSRISVPGQWIAILMDGNVVEPTTLKPN